MGNYLFINPGSGSYDLRLVNEMIDRLESASFPVKVFNVRTPADVSTCCRSIYENDDRPCIVVAAGDGTINAVLNGLRPGTATLGVLPLGTSNVLAAELGIHSLREGLEKIIRGTTRPLSIGVIEMQGAHHRFALMAGIGLDGAVVKGVGPWAKRFLKQGAFVLSALKA